MNTKQLDKWMIAYERNLHAVREKYPAEYAYGPEMIPGVVVKMREAFEKDSYNLDGRAIAATCKEMGIKATRKAITAWLAQEDPRTDAEVDVIMSTPMELKKGRDGWVATSWIHIPGRPEKDDSISAQVKTHVLVTTSKQGRGGISTGANEVTKTTFGFSLVFDYHKPAPWERLGESPDRCTEKSVALLHRVSLAKLKELRPELFPDPRKLDPHVAAQIQAVMDSPDTRPEATAAPVVEQEAIEGPDMPRTEPRAILDQLEANGAMPEGERMSDKEPDATGMDEEGDDAGRFQAVPPIFQGPVSTWVR